jgi:UDP-N-acetylglucosamine/UDP-N-acetylgalactosamine diphosphorylase
MAKLDIVFQALEKLKQGHIQDIWQKSTSLQQKQLEDDLEELDLSLLEKEIALVSKDLQVEKFSPLPHVIKTQDNKAYKLGKKLVAAGKVAVIFMAGGQGTRLGLKAPKGTYPISLIKKKSLFQIFAEKILACQKLVQKELEIIFMTSPENHVQTIAFFSENKFFGLKKSQVHFFVQTELPILDEQGKLVVEPGKIVGYADGNGSLFWNLKNSGLLRNLKDLGIEYFSVMMIDNPLNDPFDFGLIGLHAQHQNDCTIKGIARIDPFEKVGVIVENEGKLQVVEYSELSDDEKKATDAKGEFIHKVANISYFCFSLSFIEKVTALPLRSLPLHKAKKAKPTGESYWKFEYFIFDVLAHANKVEVVLAPRDECFAPLKNKEGVHSPKTVQEAVLKRERQIFEKISGKSLPENSLFELPQDFYYPTEELTKKWAGKALPDEFKD